MPRSEPSRRAFLHLSGSVGLGAWMSLSMSGCREAADSAAEALRTGEAPRVLTDDERRTLEAFSDRVLPPDGNAPGAVALGAVVFMDHYLADHAEHLADARRALEDLHARTLEAYPNVSGFVMLDPAAQETLVGTLPESAPGTFFPLWTLVVFGAFADPAHGGNRDKEGWALLGFDDRHAWQPPFGFYDADVARGAGA